MSVFQAHKLLGLFPGRTMSKEEIKQAYLLAAKKYHPDSRVKDSKPCAVNFRQCNDAREVLLRHYGIISGRPRAVRTTAHGDQYVWREKAYHPLSFLQHSKTRVIAMSIKATILFAAFCDGVYQRRREKTIKSEENLTGNQSTIPNGI